VTKVEQPAWFILALLRRGGQAEHAITSPTYGLQPGHTPQWQLSKIVKHPSCRFWAALAAGVLAIKVAILLLDHEPMFYIGDSGAYLASAVSGWLPGDRSFVYGFVIIRAVLYVFGSLTGVVIVQSLAAAGSALLLAAVLRIGFGVGRGVAAAAAVAYAVEPLALMYERFIMTESFTMLAFASFILVQMIYLQSPRAIHLVLLAMLSTCVIALRVSYLPAMLVSMGVLPFLTAKVHDAMPAGRPRARKAVHALVLVAVTFASHAAYKNWYHYLTGGPAVYNDADGLFMLAAWSPLLTKNDFPDPELYEKLIPKVHPPIGGHFDPRLSDYGPFTVQAFGSEALVAQLLHSQPSKEDANSLAKRIAFNIAKRDPVGVISLGVNTYLDYWDPTILHQKIRLEEGNMEISGPLIKLFADNFKHDISRHHLMRTQTKDYHAAAAFWYRVLLLTPAVWLLAALVCLRHWREMVVIGIYSLGLLLSYCVLVTEPWIRYLHPLAWLILIPFAVIVAWGWRRIYGYPTINVVEAVEHGQ
jgi:hypothetical protein